MLGYWSYTVILTYLSVICACVGLLGESIIYNCAKEPEIVDLCNFLKCCGAKIDGIGSSVIKITGIKILNEVNIEYKPIQDRIEAGTFLFAAMATKGEIIFNYSDVCHICSAIKLLEKMGAKVYYDGKTMALKSPLLVKPIKVIADVFPAFPTDLQSPLCALCAYINGKNIICDNVFKNRFAFVKQLIDIGVEATIKDNSAFIKGKSENNSCNAQALDLRAGAGLIIYALGAKGESIVTDIDIIKRGYEKLDEKLKNIGADIRCIST